MLAGLPETARKHLENLMTSGTYEYQSDFARRYYNQGLTEGETRGHAQGEAHGRVQGEAHAILTVLAARGLKVPTPLRKRITSCTDTNQLKTWLQRAVTAPRTEDIFT